MASGAHAASAKVQCKIGFRVIQEIGRGG